MGTVGGRGFVGSVKFADGKTSSANVPHLNVWSFDISAAEFPQQTKTRVFGVNRPLVTTCWHAYVTLVSHQISIAFFSLTINFQHMQTLRIKRVQLFSLNVY